MDEKDREIQGLRARLSQAMDGLKRIAAMTTGEDVDVLWANRSLSNGDLENAVAYGADRARSQIGQVAREELRNLGAALVEDHRELITAARRAGFDFEAFRGLGMDEARAARQWLGAMADEAREQAA